MATDSRKIPTDPQSGGRGGGDNARFYFFPKILLLFQLFKVE